MLKNILITLCLASLTTPLLAENAIYTSVFNNRAVGGYDAVSYFTQAEPVKGNKKFITTYMDAEWRFANQANLDKFLAAPEHYAPQYGGYCAWAVGNDSIAKGDPLQWSIVDNKLYLNYNAKIKSEWEADKINFIEKADKNWPSVLEK